MGTDRFHLLRRRVVNLLGEECLDERTRAMLGDAYGSAQQFREALHQRCEELLDWAERYLVELVSRRAKLAERLAGGATWDDLEESRDELNEFADAYSDELAERAEEVGNWMEDWRLRMEERHSEPVVSPQDWLRLQRWIERCSRKVDDLLDELLTQFDEEAAEILGT